MQTGRHHLPDKSIIQDVSHKLARSGLSTTCQISVLCQHGAVTLSGTVQFDHQRRTALAAARSASGVRSVSDNMRLLPSVKDRFPVKRQAGSL